MKSIYFCIIALSFVQCSGKTAEDISTDDIKNECDCVSSMDKIVGELKLYQDAEKGSLEERSQKNLMSKLQEIKQHCARQFDIQKIADCDGFKALEKKIDGLR